MIFISFFFFCVSEIARWNASDGRCQAVNPTGFYGIPRLLKVFAQFSDRHVFCCGQANEITILNATTLEVKSVNLLNYVFFFNEMLLGCSSLGWSF